MIEAAPIVLANEPGFALGILTVRPGLRQMEGPGGASETLQPRVMQVLVALTRAKGAIVTRDELTTMCWDGRIVGDDALNRVLSKLRGLAAGIGQDSFQIETITKVGYRLIAGDPPAAEAPAGPALAGSSRHLPRRELMIGGAALLLVGGGAAVWRATTPDTPRSVREALAAATAGLLNPNAPNIAAAISLLQATVRRVSGSAEAWGLLAIAQAFATRWLSTTPREEGRRRAREAIDHAYALQPGQPEAVYAEQALLPYRNAPAKKEQALTAAATRHPKSAFVRFGLGELNGMTGRMGEAVRQFSAAADILGGPPPLPAAYLALCLWAGGGSAAADRIVDRAMDRYPLTYFLWQTRFDMLLLGGHADQALAFATDINGVPPAMNAELLANAAMRARALANGNPAAIDAAIAAMTDLAQHGAGDAANAIKFAGAAGRIDQAFTLAQAYYFGRGFAVPDTPFAHRAQQTFTYGDRDTSLLFMPPMRGMRADPRFATLVGQLGLRAFWTQSGRAADRLI